jgi:hypothetical protein
VEPFDLLDVGIVGHESGEGYSEVVAEGTLFSSLILEIIDKFRVLSVFAC